MAKICPASGKECLVDCGDGYCYVNKVAPVLANDLKREIIIKSAQYTQLNCITSTETATKLAEQIGEAAIRLIDKK